MSDILVTMDDGSQALVHYGVLGMKWGQRNAETLRKYLGEKRTARGQKKYDKQTAVVAKKKANFERAYNPTNKENETGKQSRYSLRRNVATQSYNQALNKQAHIKSSYKLGNMSEQETTRAKAHQYQQDLRKHSAVGGLATYGLYRLTKSGKERAKAYKQAYAMTVAEGAKRVQTGMDAYANVVSKAKSDLKRAEAGLEKSGARVQKDSLGRITNVGASNKKQIKAVNNWMKASNNPNAYKRLNR